MFENYQNISTQYTPNNYQTNNMGNQSIQTSNPNKPYEVKDARGNLIGYFWYYGNSVVLTFDISGEYTSVSENVYVDVQDVLSGCTLTLTIYDNRYNIIHQESVYPNSTSVDFVIDSQVSSKMLKGKYTMQLVASNGSGYNETLFGVDTCIFEVR